MAARTNLPLSWEAIERDAKALARQLVAHGPFRGIVAVTRGGLVPAAIVARALDIRLIETLCIKSYDDRARQPGSVEVLKGVSGDGEGLLIVDDLVDTGETARVVRGQLPRAHFATLYAKPLGRPFVDTVVTEVSQETWIVFPWER